MPEIIHKLASFLPPNDVACSLRLADRASSQLLADRVSVRLSQPVSRGAFAAHWSAGAPAYRELTLAQRRQLLSLTAASGDLVNLQTALAAAGVVPTACLVEAAAKANQLEVCRWLIEPCRRPADLNWHHLLQTAAGAGHRDVCAWVLEAAGPDGQGWTADAITAAARGGFSSLVEWLQSVRPPTAYVPWVQLTEAAMSGYSLAAFRDLVPDDKGPHTMPSAWKTQLMDAALGSPTPDWREKVAWLQAHGCVPSGGAFSAVVDSLPDALTVDRLSHLCATARTDFGGMMDALELAASTGKPLAAVWLLNKLQSRVHPDALDGGRALLLSTMRQMLRAAADRGHAQVLGALAPLLTGARFHTSYPEVVAPGGSLEALRVLLPCLQSAEDIDFAEDDREDLVCAAARSGAVEVLRHLVTPLAQGGGGCRAVKAAWAPAAASGSEAALCWLLEQRCAPPTDGEPYIAAAHNGDLRTLGVLRCMGAALGPASVLTRAIVTAGPRPYGRNAAAPLPALQWLLAAGCSVDWDKAVEAAGARVRFMQHDGEAAAVRAWVEEQRAAAGR